MSAVCVFVFPAIDFFMVCFWARANTPYDVELPIEGSHDAISPLKTADMAAMLDPVCVRRAGAGRRAPHRPDPTWRILATNSARDVT